MTDNENFDELIRNKFQNRKFDADENKWLKAQAIIEADERKKKKRVLGWFSILGLLLLTGGAFLFFGSNKMDVPASNSKIVSFNEKDTTINSSETDVIVKKDEVKTTSKGTPMTAGSTGSKSNTILPKEQITINSSASQIKTHQQVSQLEKHSGSVSIHKNSSANTSSSVSGNIPEKKDAVKDPLPQSDLTLNTTGNTKIPSEIKKPEQNEPTALILPVPDTNHTLTVTKKDSAPAPLPLVTNTTLPEMPNAHSHAWTLSFIAGTNYSLPSHFGPVAGIQVTRAFTDHFELGTGLYYTSLLPPDTGNTKTFYTDPKNSFGSSYDMIRIRTDRLHYAALPLFAKFNLNDKNSFLIGADLYYLFTVSNTYTSNTNIDGSVENTSTKKTYGYAKGFTPFNLVLNAAYERTLSRKLSLGIAFNYGLTDMKRDLYYNETVYNRTINTQVTLRYELLKK